MFYSFGGNTSIDYQCGNHLKTDVVTSWVCLPGRLASSEKKTLEQCDIRPINTNTYYPDEIMDN